MIRRSSDSRQLIGGKGNYAPASASDNLPFLLKIASTPPGFGGKGIRTPDFQLAKLALYQLSYAPGEGSILDWVWRIANLGSGVRHLSIRDLSIRGFGEADAGWRSEDRHPGFVRFSAKLRPRATKNGPVSPFISQ